MRLHALMTLAVITGLALTGCAQEAGWTVDRQGNFGNPTMQNSMMMSGEAEYTYALAQRFAAEVPNTVNFEFNRSDITPEAAAVLQRQAQWIRQFPEVRFKVFGFTDNVGGEKFNYGLGMRRARAVVAYLKGLGIGSARLEAVVSYGKTRPLIDVPGPEMRNRRALTEVTGFVQNDPMVLNGKYAAIVWRTYANPAKSDSLAERPHPANTDLNTQVNPSDGGN